MDIQLIKKNKKKALAWISSPYYDEETKSEIRQMLDSED